MSLFGGIADAIRDMFGGGRSSPPTERASGAVERSPRPRARSSAMRSAAERQTERTRQMNEASGVDREGPEDRRREREAAAPAPAPAPAPRPAPVTESGMTPAQEAQIEKAGETAVTKARRLGLASTIATSPGGLLMTDQAARPRRSLIGGGLIR
jgi:hypothetical protein